MKPYKRFCLRLLAVAVALTCMFALSEKIQAAGGSPVAGDIDGNGVVNQNDAVYLLLHTMFGEANYPLHNAAADFARDGKVNQEDAVYLLLHTMFGETNYPLNSAPDPEPNPEPDPEPQECSHAGGKATCSAQAVCIHCGKGYGEKDPNYHNMQKTADAVAAGCGKAGKTEVYTCQYGCGKTQGGEPIAALQHAGGKATCSAQAICIHCGKGYGEKDPTNHKGGTEIRGAYDAAVGEPGYTGDTYCLGCNTKIKDGEMIEPEEVGPTVGENGTPIV